MSKSAKNSAATLSLLAAASIGISLLATCFGTISIDGFAAWQEFLTQPNADWPQDTHILSLRIPRVVLAWIAGGALATAGAVVQTLLRNSEIPVGIVTALIGGPIFLALLVRDH